MRWRRGKTPDVIDRRGAGGGRSGGGGLGGGLGGGGLPIPTGRGGKVGGLGLIIVLVIVGLQIFGGGGGGGGGFQIPGAFDEVGGVPGAQQEAPIPPGEDPQKDLKDFSGFVFTDAQQTWSETFAQLGAPYRNAKLVLYSGGVDTGGCGSASSAVGPFYCPADQSVYLDLSFYEDMERQLQAPGDFAWAYVIAHEVGHHVQRQIGTTDEVESASRSNSDDANELSVRLELQADCYAGVWGSTVTDLLEQGDLQEAFTATEAIGDDRLQQRGGGSVDPDSFTHGSSEQRERWFKRGYEGGDPAACDTFSVDEL